MGFNDVPDSKRIDNQDKARAMADAGDKFRTSATKERKDNLENPPGWIDRLLRKGMIKYKDQIGERRENFAGILYDISLKYPNASEEDIERMALSVLGGEKTLEEI